MEDGAGQEERNKRDDDDYDYDDTFTEGMFEWGNPFALNSWHSAFHVHPAASGMGSLSAVSVVETASCKDLMAHFRIYCPYWQKVIGPGVITILFDLLSLSSPVVVSPPFPSPSSLATLFSPLSMALSSRSLSLFLVCCLPLIIMVGVTDT